ncbi:Tn3-like element ISVsa19 family transposase [Aliivibrio salmonicida]|uniref:Transposase n=1 Tax=Aliivibrio salmonicida (strain LFI1238) TaxID=316275 RepID=B6ET66_ALISL|nr:Tn3-like element ISVsa19 family transposase [Aliivibrio salmonicida]CAQ81955.1 transposase [Aliivibrio salmonicida LFI1238]
MTKLAIFTPKEQRDFDTPPKFYKIDRSRYFSISSEIKRSGFNKLRTDINRVGFILQLGYFRASGKFYVKEDFRKRDIKYVCNMLEITEKIDINLYSDTSRKYHRDNILSLSGWKLPDESHDEKLNYHAKWFIEQQLSPRKVIKALVEYCWSNKLIIPTYSKLSAYITVHFNDYEEQLLVIIKKQMTKEQNESLQTLFNSIDKTRPLSRPPITSLKTINQSVKPTEIQKNVETFEMVKSYHLSVKTLTHHLQLTDQATEYFATWVKKAQTFQLTSFSSTHKAYLHMLAYLKHQFYLRQDTLIDIYLKSTLSTKSQLTAKLQQIEKEQQSGRNTAIKVVSKSNKNLTKFRNRVIDIVTQSPLSDTEVVRQLENLIEESLRSYDKKEQDNIREMESFLAALTGNGRYFDIVESLSLKLQRRVSNILKIVEFSDRSTNKELLSAINHFSLSDGDVGHNPPLEFLNQAERDAVVREGKFRVSLYKALLFFHVADDIKAGQLIFDATYKYKGIFDYLIDEETWAKDRDKLLQAAGLWEFSNVSTVLDGLRKKLNIKYHDVNIRLVEGKNPYFQLDSDNRPKVKTPKIDNNDFGFVGDTLMQNGYVPIQKILADVNQVCDFKSCFTHFSNKHKKMKPSLNVLLAGLLGKGCNLGLNRIANISVGISEDVLNNTVKWFFDLKNIQAASDSIVSYIDKLSLANAYRHDANQLHTSSDGQKYYVSVDSLNSTYSFKYFGSEKGSTVYTFIDERQALFYSTVISASEREAAYVLDGITHNDVVKSDIHSTDTHGYTESIFGAAHFMGTSFAPRIKGLGSQTIYDFDGKSLHSEKGHTIRPSRAIRKKLIKDNWEDILRFMVTIKLKKASASRLFSRLNSYTKQMPLYNALKEFGRIMKSNFLLTYYDDMELRQRIEKQLNRVELSNKLAKAIFFANNQEIQEGEKDEQDLTAACKMLIQNSIVLWNYLYLSQYLANLNGVEERTNAAQSILNGSVLTWRHINLHGQYDFTRDSANDDEFDLERILALLIV